MPAFKLPQLDLSRLPIPQKTGERVLGGLLATTTLVGGAAACSTEGPATGPTLHFNDNCFGAHAAPNAPVDRPITGTLPDGRTFKVLLDPASTPTQREFAADVLCTAKLGAAADAKVQQATLDADPSKAKRTAAESALRADQRVYAATDLALIHDTLERPATASPALEDVKKTPAPQGDALIKDEVALDAAAKQHAAAARTLGQPSEDERWYVTNDVPEELAAVLDPLATATASDATRVNDVRAHFEALAHDEASAMTSVLDLLAKQANPLWTADHPGAPATAADLGVIKNGIAHGQKFGDMSKGLQAAYRKAPGVADKHLKTLVAQAVAPVFARELPGTKPSAAAINKAKAMWIKGATNAQISAAIRKDIRSSVAWRKFLISKNIHKYYQQPNNWSCGPSSSTNILGLLGIAPENVRTSEEVRKTIHQRYGHGVPGTVDLLAKGVKTVAKRHGATVTGYRGYANKNNAGIIKALKNGYVVIVNGDVVNTVNGIHKHRTSGHFLVIAGMDKHGNFIMRDPWPVEFKNRTIPQSLFNRFTHGGVHVSKFYAFTRVG